MSESIELDHSVISQGSKSLAPAGDDVLHWLAYYTREIETRHRSIVRHRLVAPNYELAEIIAHAATSSCEVAWQENREILTSENVGISVATPEVTVLTTIRLPPEAIAERLKKMCYQAADRLKQILHLGANDDTRGGQGCACSARVAAPLGRVGQKARRPASEPYPGAAF